MSTIEVQLGDRKWAERYLKTGADEHTPNVNTGDDVIDSVTGETLLIVREYAGDRAKLRQAFAAFPNSTVLRAAGVRNNAVTFGYTASNPVMQRYACRSCSVAETHPDAHAQVVEAAMRLYAMLFEAVPGIAEATYSMARGAISDEWLMPDSPWTSGVLNTTSPLPYHYDRNNMPGWSAMVVARRGVSGGHLHIPQMDVTVACRDGDVVFFPGWQYVHGVTPMKMQEKGAYRFSAVYYTINKMAKCLAPAEELARGRLDRTTAEHGMIERQRGSGMLTK